MHWLTIKFISSFLLPPLNFLLLGVAGLVLSRTRPRLGRNLLLLMVALLWIFSMPVTGNALAMLLEQNDAAPPTLPSAAQAIVVLGNDVYYDAPEYAGGTVGKVTLERLRYAAILQRRTGLPILVSGGDAEGRGVAPAVLMKKTLEEDFQTPVRWLEAESSDTMQNAVYSKKILDANGVKTILLVTHGWHMPRSRRLFEQTGFNVLSAGTGFHSLGRLTIIDFLPGVYGLEDSRMFFHETIGMLWTDGRSMPREKS